MKRKLITVLCGLCMGSASFAADATKDAFVKVPIATPTEVANWYIGMRSRDDRIATQKFLDYLSTLSGYKGTVPKPDPASKKRAVDAWMEKMKPFIAGDTPAQQTSARQAAEGLLSALTDRMWNNNCAAGQTAMIKPNTPEGGMNVVATLPVRCTVPTVNLTDLSAKFKGKRGVDEWVKLVNELTRQVKADDHLRPIETNFVLYGNTRNYLWNPNRDYDEFVSWYNGQLFNGEASTSMRTADGRVPTLFDTLAWPEIQARINNQYAVLSPLDSELVGAVSDNDTVAVKKLLAAGANPTPKHTGDMRIPMTMAIVNNNLAMVKLMLPKADPNWALPGEHSLLSLSISRGDKSLEITRALAAAGARLGTDHQLVVDLVTKAVGRFGNPQLRTLAWLLEQKEVDVNFEGTPWQGQVVEAAAGDLQALTVLSRTGKVKPLATTDGSTPFMSACERSIKASQSGQEMVQARQRIELLIKLGYNINAQTQDGDSALHIYHANPVCQIELINHGADVNRPNHKGSTPIYYSLPENNGTVMEALIAKGAKVNIANNIGSTPLHEAALQKSPVNLDKLLKAGANPNAKDQFGWTPLALAEKAGLQANIMLLKPVTR